MHASIICIPTGRISCSAKVQSISQKQKKQVNPTLYMYRLPITFISYLLFFDNRWTAMIWFRLFRESYSTSRVCKQRVPKRTLPLHILTDRTSEKGEGDGVFFSHRLRRSSHSKYLTKPYKHIFFNRFTLSKGQITMIFLLSLFSLTKNSFSPE